MYLLVAGATRVSVPLFVAHESPLLETLDPEEPVPLPAFIESRLVDVPYILSCVSTSTPDATQFPSMEGLAGPEALREALHLLKICEFLDIPKAVRALHVYIQTQLAACATVDAVLRLVCPRFENEPVEAQRRIYALLMRKFSTLRRGVPGAPTA